MYTTLINWFCYVNSLSKSESKSWGGRQEWGNGSWTGHSCIYHVRSMVTSKRIELVSPGCSGLSPFCNLLLQTPYWKLCFCSRCSLFQFYLEIMILNMFLILFNQISQNVITHQFTKTISQSLKQLGIGKYQQDYMCVYKTVHVTQLE